MQVLCAIFMRTDSLKSVVSVASCKAYFPRFRLLGMPKNSFMDPSMAHGPPLRSLPVLDFKPYELTNILGDSKFHAYLSMVVSLHNVVEEIGVWCESCSCHEGHEKGTHPKRGRKLLTHRQSWASCPMRGKRLPELVAGILLSSLES